MVHPSTLHMVTPPAAKLVSTNGPCRGATMEPGSWSSKHPTRVATDWLATYPKTAPICVAMALLLEEGEDG
jgi:hypothetical protein